MKYLLPLLSVILLQNGLLNAQTGCCPYIDSIQVIPSAPTNQDTIMIVTRSSTPCLGHRIYYAHSLIKDTIFLDGCFYSGMLTAVQTFYDTTWILPLPTGIRHIHYIGRISNDVTRCEMVQFQTMAATFTVTGTSTGTGAPATGKPTWNICPNPTNNLITLNFPDHTAQAITWTLNDLNGRCLLSGTTERDITTIDLSHLPQGVYMFRGVTAGEVINAKVLKR